jgi:hypothetical protein
LLAYLDDTLEPEQARLIGQKVAESDAAQELIARIKQVTRRRRLTTPPTAGPGAKLDINTIADYLDNALSPEKLAEVEEICLSSDVHLAEIAACHQILTLVLGEPILIPPTARQRMYRLIRGREAIPNRAVRAAGIGQGAQELLAPGGNGEAEGIGPSLSRAAGIRGLMPVAAACLLLAAVAALWLALRTGSGPPVTKVEPAAGAPAVPTVVASNQPAPASPAPADTVRPAAAASAKPPVGPKPESSPPPRKEPEPVKTAAAEKKAPGGESATPPPPAAAKSPAPSPGRIAPPRAERLEVGQYVLAADTAGVFLQRANGSGPWQRLKPQNAAYSNDYLVSLPGYRSEIWAPSGVRVQLWGNLPEFHPIPVFETALTPHPRAGTDFDFTLDRGLVVLSNHKKEGPAVIRVRFAGETWDVTLLDRTSVVAVQLVGMCAPYGADHASGEPTLYVGVIGLEGQALLQVRYNRIPLISPAIFHWDNIHGPDQDAEAKAQAPPWWSNKTLPRGPMQAAVDGLTKRLLVRQEDGSLEISLAEMINDREPSSRILAVRCLGAMNDWPDLLDALGNEQFADVRIVALGELRHLLGLSPKNDEALAGALRQKNFSEPQAKAMLQLVHGFAPELWAKPATRSALVEYLLHEKLAIRQAAYLLLNALVRDGQKIAYDPAGSVAQRQRGYQAWRDLIEAGNRPKQANGKDRGTKK